LGLLGRKEANAFHLKALSTLSQKSETFAEFGDSRRFLRQSHFSATVWTGLNSATVCTNISDVYRSYWKFVIFSGE